MSISSEEVDGVTKCRYFSALPNLASLFISYSNSSNFTLIFEILEIYKIYFYLFIKLHKFTKGKYYSISLK